MRQKRKKMIISILCGLLAAVFMGLYAASLQGGAGQSAAQVADISNGQKTEIFVATRDIAAGERLSSANVASRAWPTELLPAGAQLSEDDVFGQTLLIPLFKNEPVVAAKLGSAAQSFAVPEGYCAVSIPTSNVLAVGGAIGAGSRIAIYAADKQSVELIAAEVLVLETSNASQASSGSSSLFGSGRSQTELSWVTLSVREDVVEDIIAASRNMSLYLVLPGGDADD